MYKIVDSNSSEEIVSDYDSENQTANIDLDTNSNVNNKEILIQKEIPQKSKISVFRRFDWERDGTLNVL